MSRDQVVARGDNAQQAQRTVGCGLLLLPEDQVPLGQHVGVPDAGVGRGGARGDHAAQVGDAVRGASQGLQEPAVGAQGVQPDLGQVVVRRAQAVLGQAVQFRQGPVVLVQPGQHQRPAQPGTGHDEPGRIPRVRGVPGDQLVEPADEFGERERSGIERGAQQGFEFLGSPCFAGPQFGQGELGHRCSLGIVVA